MKDRTGDGTLGEVVSAMTRRYDTGDVLDALVAACRDDYPAAAVAVLAGRPAGELQLMSATSHRADELELLQLQEGAGPCLEAMRTGVALLASSGQVSRRWPAIGTAMDRAGYSSVHAYPMTWRGRPVGGLNVFLDHEDVDSSSVAHTGQLYADLATLAVAHAGDHVQDSLADQVQGAIRARSVVEQAKGVLAYQRGVTPAAAYDLMRARARDEGAHLSDVARAVVASAGDSPRR
ncbi:MAG: hypothetical protein JWR42_1889 [Marmoricola sp.]|nr:hypothetical protein [Marmoricola sp.]